MKKASSGVTGSRSKRSQERTAIQIIDSLEFDLPYEEMLKRWDTRLQYRIPSIDQEDVRSERKNGLKAKRQFAPEFSQSSYIHMLRMEQAVGNYTQYTSHNKKFSVKNEERREMVQLIEKIQKIKEYKEETYFLAVSLADRYLVHIAVHGQDMPSLISLGVTAILMAAKLEQPISPSFSRMVRLVDETFGLKVEKKTLIDLEEAIIRVLDFSLYSASPITFMERYLRIFGVDRIGSDEDADMVSALARKIISIMIKDRSYLNFKPS